MSMNDPISDMLTRIRNAQAVQKKTVEYAGVKNQDGYRRRC